MDCRCRPWHVAQRAWHMLDRDVPEVVGRSADGLSTRLERRPSATPCKTISARCHGSACLKSRRGHDRAPLRHQRPHRWHPPARRRRQCMRGIAAARPSRPRELVAVDSYAARLPSPSTTLPLIPRARASAAPRSRGRPGAVRCRAGVCRAFSERVLDAVGTESRLGSLPDRDARMHRRRARVGWMAHRHAVAFQRHSKWRSGFPKRSMPLCRRDRPARGGVSQWQPPMARGRAPPLVPARPDGFPRRAMPARRS